MDKDNSAPAFAAKRVHFGKACVGTKGKVTKGRTTFKNCVHKCGTTPGCSKVEFGQGGGCDRKVGSMNFNIEHGSTSDICRGQGSGSWYPVSYNVLCKRSSGSGCPNSEYLGKPCTPPNQAKVTELLLGGSLRVPPCRSLFGVLHIVLHWQCAFLNACMLADWAIFHSLLPAPRLPLAS